MSRIIFTLLILTSSFCWSEKYVFVSDKKIWSDAREHCRSHYIDYLDLTSEEEEQALKKYVNGDVSKAGWIGVYWDKPTTKWKWSGGDNVTYDSNFNLPANLQGATEHIAENIYWTKDGWEWRKGGSSQSFFCLNMHALKEKKTWEDALEHCRNKSADLTSLLSATQNRHAQNEIQLTGFTEQVWIGLRFLGNRWLWVNGDPLSYEAWADDGDPDHQCPMLRRCVALTKHGVWENRDCQEKLSFICA